MTCTRGVLCREVHSPCPTSLTGYAQGSSGRLEKRSKRRCGCASAPNVSATTMARINGGLAIAADGETLELLDGRSSDGSLTMAIDRFCDAALGLGQATWGWAQTIHLEAPSDLTRFERVPADVV